jgi:hypothetical protein
LLGSVVKSTHWVPQQLPTPPSSAQLAPTSLAAQEVDIHAE